MADNVNHPDHYTQGGVECIDALAAATEGLSGIEAVCTANAIKYLWRWKRKNGIEDLRKALWYINHLVSKAAPPSEHLAFPRCPGCGEVMSSDRDRTDSLYYTCTNHSEPVVFVSECGGGLLRRVPTGDGSQWHQNAQGEK